MELFRKFTIFSSHLSLAIFVMLLVFDLPVVVLIFKNWNGLSMLLLSAVWQIFWHAMYTQFLPRPAMKESNVTKQRYYWQIYVYTVPTIMYNTSTYYYYLLLLSTNKETQDFVQINMHRKSCLIKITCFVMQKCQHLCYKETQLS